MKYTHTLVSNLKSVLLKRIEDPSLQANLKNILMYITPLTMFGVKANIDVSFDDYSSIEEHPMAQQALLSFDSIFGLVSGMSQEDLRNMPTEIGDEPDSEEQKEIWKILNGRNNILSFLANLADDKNLEVKFSVPNFLLSGKITIASAGLGNALDLGVRFASMSQGIDNEYAAIKNQGVEEDAF